MRWVGRLTLAAFIFLLAITLWHGGATAFWGKSEEARYYVATGRTMREVSRVAFIVSAAASLMFFLLAPVCAAMAAWTERRSWRLAVVTALWFGGIASVFVLRSAVVLWNAL